MKKKYDSDINEIIDDIIANDTSVFGYQYYNCLKNRTIVLNDVVNKNIVEKVIIPLINMDNDGTGDPITIIVNTPGGDAFTGFALVDVIEKLKTKTTIRLMGSAMSMGIFIAMAHYNNPNVETICSKYSVGLLHAGSLFLGEMNLSSAKDYFKFNEKYEEVIKEYIFSHSNITEEIYSKIERSECYMTANEMLEYGMVSRIE